MKFNYLSVENYKSFQFPTRLDFPQSDNGKSIFLVGGMNGAGKTSVMEAINICLYGERADNIYKCINHKELAKGNAFVSFELEFTTDSFETIVVSRSWSANTCEQPLAKDLVEKLIVVKDGKRVSVQNKEMWQDYINSTIPKSITQFFFFDGEKIQQVAADDHSEVLLKDSLEAALGIQYISRLADDVLYIKQEERRGFVEISDEDIEYKESELKKERRRLKDKQDELFDCQTQIAEYKQQKEEASVRFKNIFSIDPESSEVIKQKEKKRISLSSQSNQLDSQIKNLIEKYLPWAMAGQLFEPLKQQIEKEKTALQSKFFADNASELTQQIVYTIDNPIPLTGLPLSEQQKKEIESRLLALFSGNKEQVEKILNLSDRDAARVFNKIEEIEKSDVLQLQDLISQKQEIDDEIANIQSSLQLRGNSHSEQELFSDLQEIMESCHIQIGRLSVTINNLQEEIRIIENRIKEIEIELNKLYDRHNSSMEKKQLIDECDTIASMLKSYIVKLRRNKIQLLREKTFEMYQQLSSKADLIKSIDIDEKTYEITIHDKNDNVVRKSGLSAGEKEVFAISLLWGLAQTSQLNLPIIIDTPLSRIDSIHRDNIVRKYFTNAAEQVIILSTDTEVDDNYFRYLEPNLSGAARLVFSKNQQLTTISEGYFWK